MAEICVSIFLLHLVCLKQNIYDVPFVIDTSWCFIDGCKNVLKQKISKSNSSTQLIVSLKKNH